jgi:hypothetical protein
MIRWRLSAESRYVAPLAITRSAGERPAKIVELPFVGSALF